jgi:hypothetical protein
VTVAVVFAATACDLSPPSPAAAPVVLASSPADGDLDVARDGAFRAFMDRRLVPLSVGRGSVRVESGDVRLLLSVRFDPVDVAIVAEPLFGDRMAARTTYRFVIDGVRDLEDRRLGEPFTATFQTGDRLAGVGAPAPPEPAQALRVLDARCGRADCHGASRPAVGLDLSSGDGIARTAIGHPARGAEAGTVGVEGGRGAPVLASLPIVDVVAGRGSPETSYLLYKILGDPHVSGSAMPPTGPLPPEEVRLLSDWIAAGAPTD